MKRKLTILLMLLCVVIIVVGINKDKVQAADNHVVFDEGSKVLTVTGLLTRDEFKSIEQFRNSAEKLIVKDLEYQNCSSMFAGFNKLKEAYIDGLKTNYMNNMFGAYGMDFKADVKSGTYCSSLTTIKFSNVNRSKVYSMSYMFLGCSELINVNLQDLDVSNVTSMYAMFHKCIKLAKN